MSSDAALYRRHRPLRFSDFSGGGADIQDLSRAVASGATHHAYLLTGPRGIGKTTTARLVAMGLNCESGPTDTPCGECYQCQSIRDGNSMDVQEIDAASNNSVDDIRDLRNKTSTVAAFGGYRVYILDEAHMLSTSAWNALLKTLEEPPPQTVFILCTTELRKVPETVRSRCRHIALKAATAAEVSARIKTVAEREGVTIEDNAATLLGRAARGSYRDALGLLEAAIARGGGEAVTEAAVRSLLGAEDEMKMFEALKAVGDGDVKKTLAAAAQLAADRDPDVILRDLEQLARDVLISAALGKVPASLQTTKARDDLLALTANMLKSAGTARLLDEIANAMVAVRAGADPRVRLELALVKTADPSLAPDSAQMARRVDRLEAAVMSRQTSRRPTGQ